MKNILLLTFIGIFSFSALAQKNIEVTLKTVKSDYIVEYERVEISKILIDSITKLRYTVVSLYKVKEYTNYRLLDSVFRYDSLLPTYFDNYTISDQYGNYQPDYGYDDYAYDDDYDDYSYDDYDSDYDDYDDYDDDYVYDDEYADDYKVTDSLDTEVRKDTTLTDYETVETDDYVLEAEEKYSIDSTYVFMGKELYYASNREIVTNFYDYMTNEIAAYNNVKGHKVHKVTILDTIGIIEKDTVTSFQLETVSWPKLRKLPLKVFIEEKLGILGSKDPNYELAMDKPITYEDILKAVIASKPSFEIDTRAWDSITYFGINPNEYLADIVWIEYLIPYYAAYVQDPYLRDLFGEELRKKRTEKILDFKNICGYDFRNERSLRNIIRDTTILKNPRFERTIDEEKKIPIIKDHAQLAFSVTEYMNKSRGRMEYQPAGIISTIYETEKFVIADSLTGQPIKVERIKIDPKTNKPVLLETASFGITFKLISVESLQTAAKNMKYDISKLIRNDSIYSMRYLKATGRWKKRE